MESEQGEPVTPRWSLRWTYVDEETSDDEDSGADENMEIIAFEMRAFDDDAGIESDVEEHN